jgi:transcriptional regulator with XRE-family HTH domain
VRRGIRKASPEILARLANNLKLLRAVRGLTQEELAKLCRLNRSYIGNVEQALVNITLANLEALARGLDCSEAELLMRHIGGTGNNPPYARAPVLSEAALTYGKKIARRQQTTSDQVPEESGLHREARQARSPLPRR